MIHHLKMNSFRNILLIIFSVDTLLETMGSTKVINILEYLGKWENLLQGHPGRICVDCSLSSDVNDLIVKFMCSDTKHWFNGL